MSNSGTSVTFSGAVTSQAAAGEAVTITVTNPDGSTTNLAATTDNNGNYTVSQNFQPGEYSAVASVAADADYGSATSPSVPFTVGLGTRSITLNVSVASS